MKNEWRKSTRSTGCGACVEVRKATGGVQVRDSKNPALGTLNVSKATWAALLGSVR